MPFFQEVSGLSVEQEVLEWATRRLSSLDIATEELTLVVEILKKSDLGRLFIREVLGEVDQQWQLTSAIPTKSPALDRLRRMAARGTLAGRVQEAVRVHGWDSKKKWEIVGKAR